MSRFDDEQKPGPSVESASGEPEPRLLTRSVPPESDKRQRPTVGHRQHVPERGLRAWAGRLAQHPQGRKPAANSASAKSRAATTAPVSSPKAWHRGAPVLLRWALTGLVLLLVLLCGWFASLRHASVAALPMLDGEVAVSGLHGAVTVTRDAQGVPSITANSLPDLLFAQGYVTAGDRLWQMDALRRHAAGELAEVLGPGLVEHDRRQRLLQLRATADRAVTHLPEDQKEMLEAYTAGVNRYLDTHRGALPLEFRLLAYTPAPWTPRDSLLVALVMFQDMSTRFPQKMDREALSARLPAALLPDLYPVGSWRDVPPAAQNHSISAPHPVELIPLDPSQAKSRLPQGGPGLQGAPAELLAVDRALASTNRCPDCRAGSNNWAVSGQHTASGKPLLSNDMHLNLSIPDTWYEASLHAPLPAGTTAQTATGADSVAPGVETGASMASPVPAQLDVTGFTLPGLPLVIVGRNAHVGWGLTNLGADVQDIRVEHLRRSGADAEFEHPDGSWSPVGHRKERIRVRGGLDRTLDVLTVTHTVGDHTMETPVISPLYPSDFRVLSLAWSAYDPAALNLPLLAVDSAPDGAALDRAYASFGGPTLNLVWADMEGHIGYHAIGMIPVRGPATQHPRAMPTPAPAMDPNQPPVIEGGEGGEGDQTPAQPGPAAFYPEVAQPRLLRTAWRPERTHRRMAPRSLPVRARRRGRPARQLRAKALRSEPAALPAPVESGVPSAPAPRNYTIGSPLSPVPVDALDPSQEWSGYIAYDDLPAVTDPTGGVLATANSRITPDDYPWAVAEDWADPFRTERIVHILNKRQGLRPADMLAIENDVHSDVDQAMGQRLAYALDHASPKALQGDARRLHQAADLLRSWDGEVTTASSGAALLATVREALWPALLDPQIARASRNELSRRQIAAAEALYNWGERTTALELLLQHEPSRWLPPAFANWNDFLSTVTEQALVAAHAPADLSRWHYGQRHTIEIAHPVLGQHPLLSKLLGVPGTTGVQPAPGDFTTIKAIGAHFGPSERFTADLASPEEGLANLTTGESGDGRSPWYLDQFAPWLAGTSFALPGTHTRATHTLRLVPAGGAS